MPITQTMKIQFTFLLILLTILAIGGETVTDKNSAWNPAELNTAANANYLTPLEKEIILETNKLRSNPAQYAKEYIEPLAKNYKGKILYYPGDKPLMTREGVSALHECVRALKKQSSLPILHPSAGLSKAAHDHVKDQSRTGKTGHTGGDRSTSRQRIERYGDWDIRIAENIAYGGISARQIVIYLLIDDGVKNRGHRKNFLNPDFKVVGVATGSHPAYGSMTVIDYAGAFQ
ncbi:MAG: CAP domain-containing protein [Tangfeifania sp.]